MFYNKLFGRGILTGALAGGLLLFMGTTPARADRDSDEHNCRERVEKAQADVDHDNARYGEHSRQVSSDLKKLDAAREWCGKHHANWDHDRDKDYDRYRDTNRR
jgi:hypothetical protein